jgi:hypothetical protein
MQVPPFLFHLLFRRLKYSLQDFLVKNTDEQITGTKWCYLILTGALEVDAAPEDTNTSVSPISFVSSN